MRENYVRVTLLCAAGLLLARLGAADEGKGDLEELLRLPAEFFASDSGESSTWTWADRVGGFFERHGLAPEIGGVVSGSGWGLGLTHTFWSDADNAMGWRALRTYKGYNELGLFYARKLDTSGRFRLYNELRHRDLPQEDYFGLGLQSAASDRTRFDLAENRARSELGITLSDSVGLSLHGSFRNVRVQGGPESSSDSFDYGGLGAAVYWDTRDNPRYARRGSLAVGELEQFVGLGGSASPYRRFALEFQNALPLPERDHVLVSRVRADWMTSASGLEIPFFLSRGLGGSHALRSFPLNRFRGEDLLLATLEYRHALFGGKLDAVAFWDVGGVYGRLNELSIGSLRHSFGAGIRVLRKKGVLVRLEVAHGAEGTRLLFGFSAPF